MENYYNISPDVVRILFLAPAIFGKWDLSISLIVGSRSQ